MNAERRAGSQMEHFDSTNTRIFRAQVDLSSKNPQRSLENNSVTVWSLVTDELRRERFLKILGVCSTIELRNLRRPIAKPDSSTNVEKASEISREFRKLRIDKTIIEAKGRLHERNVR